MDFHSDSKNIMNSYRDSNFEQDSEDILRQLSQMTPCEDKSFDSPVVITKTKAFFNDYNIDYSQLAKENDINSFITLEEKNDRKYATIKKDDIILDENELMINNKQAILNRKLKYLCSLIQISNIKVRKINDLKQLNKCFEDKKNLLNIFEPINLLFNIINELIFIIQKELSNNDILLKELKRLRYNREEDEKQIYKLKLYIKDKDKELNELRLLKKDDFIKYNSNEINELKNENKELYKKITTYKMQIKKSESFNKEIKKRLKSFNTEKINVKHSSNLNNICQNNNNSLVPNIHTINNNLNDTDAHSSLKKRASNISEKMNKSINKNRNFSASRSLTLKCFSPNLFANGNDNYINSNNNLNNNNNNNNTNNNYNSNNNINNDNGRSIVANLMFLLKEINELLNIYNSSLTKMNINNNYYNKSNNNSNSKKNEDDQVFSDNDNMKIINNDFVNKINNVINNIENYMKEDNKNKIVNSNSNSNKGKTNNNKKMIYVNTSKFKFRKRNNNNGQKNRISVEENDNESHKSLNSFNKNDPTNRLNMKLLDSFNYIKNEYECSIK